MHKLFSEPAPYAIGVAMAFTLLAPTQASSPQTSGADVLLGAGDACAASCQKAAGWICIHGDHKDYGYWDPEA